MGRGELVLRGGRNINGLGVTDGRQIIDAGDMALWMIAVQRRTNARARGGRLGCATAATGPLRGQGGPGGLNLSLTH